MSEDREHIDTTNLTVLKRELLKKARDSGSHRAAVTIYGGGDSVLRQTLIALAAGAELGEHDSPPEATLHVLIGTITLYGDQRQWRMESGDHIQIPPERHSVIANEDSIFLLTAIRSV